MAVTQSPGQHRPHIRALDGIRGLAILIVIVHHASGLVRHTGPALSPFLKPIQVAGWIGVDLFFVLSGFLITGILIHTKKATNRGKVFYARRALRIFPIYYLTLFALLAAEPHSDWLRYSLPYTNRLDITSLLLYFQNWIPFWHGGAYAGNILGHFWSLGVEENFYMIWPLVIWSIPERLYLRVCLTGIAASLFIRLLFVWLYGPGVWVYLMTLTGVDCLLTGGALAVLAFRFGRVPRQVLVSMCAAGTLILGSIAVHNYRELGHPDAGPFAYTLAITGYALLFGALVGSSQYRFPVTRMMEAGWLMRLGRYSYGMYVYHVPLLALEYHFLFEKHHYIPRLRIELLFVVGVLVSTYVLAWASFEWFELPILNWKRHFPARVPREVSQYSPGMRRTST